MHNQGFTFIELLVILGILIFLGSVIYVINPRELLAEWRDSKRIADLNKLENTISDYLASVRGQKFEFDCASQCFASFGEVGADCGGRHPKRTAPNSGQGIDGSGWIPADLTILNELPFALLPVDPVNNQDYFFSFACDNITKTFELNAKMESKRYSQGGRDDMESTDGGDNPNIYEIGTKPGLNL